LRGTYRLPEGLRAKLAEPLGKVYSGEESKGEEFKQLVFGSPMTITVGDRVTDTLGELGRTPDLQVVDGIERRMKREASKVPFARLIKVKNPAGSITAETIAGMRKAFVGKKPVRVQVDGEEDLVAMLAIAMAPVSAMVFYGQPGVGVVAVKANAISKARNRAILAEMGIRSIR
jgi:GTP-dependent dephospho-CoA kinase